MARPWVPYVVQQGDYLDKLAFRFAIDADRLWTDPQNEDLAAKRKNRDTLYPGDVLFVPSEAGPALALTVGTANGYTANVAKVPVKLTVEVRGRDLGGKKFEVHGAGGQKPVEGTTTTAGELAFEVAVWVREVEVRLPELGIALPLHIGDLDPLDETNGIAQRLQNLGYLARSATVAAEVLAYAVRAFQRHQGLPATGVVDAATEKAIEALHEPRT